MAVSATATGLLDYCRQNAILFVDLRFSLLSGRMLHHCLPIAAIQAKQLERGVLIEDDGGAAGRILLKPALATAAIDPFYQHPTLALLATMRAAGGGPLPDDPRDVLGRALDVLRRAGIECRVGAEISFHILDQMTAGDAANAARYLVDSREGAWRRARDEPDNLGQQPIPGDAAYALPPFDTLHNLRAEMVAALAELKVAVSGHRHGRGGAGHGVLHFDACDPLALADALAVSKYIARNVAARHGKLVTFMPQPIREDAGNELTLRFELSKSGEPLLAQQAKRALTNATRSIVAGVVGHIPCLAAFVCPTTNSYRRIASEVGAGAVIELAPASAKSDELSLVFRLPDAAASPYLALATSLLAMLDGFSQKSRLAPGICAGDHSHVVSMDQAGVPLSFENALAIAVQDQTFLVRAGVLDRATIERWVYDKVRRELQPLSIRPHPYEFSLYFDV